MPNFKPPNVLPHTEMARYIFFDENDELAEYLCVERTALSPEYR